MWNYKFIIFGVVENRFLMWGEENINVKLKKWVKFL